METWEIFFAYVVSCVFWFMFNVFAMIAPSTSTKRMNITELHIMLTPIWPIPFVIFSIRAIKKLWNIV